MARRASSGRWLERQKTDQFVKQRDQHVFRSRSAYKLQEINRRDRLIRPGNRIIDLGASPGGWTQVALAAATAQGMVVAVDILAMDPLPGATIIQGDCREADVMRRVLDVVGAEGVDLVMSDMAPNITGIAVVDEAQCLELAQMTLQFSHRFLKPGGTLLIKLFQFAETQSLLTEIKAAFGEVVRRKPDSSRAESREFYVVGRRFGI